MAADLIKSAGEKDDDSAFSIIARNLSLLIHGFRAVSPKEADTLVNTYARLQALIRQDRQTFGDDPEAQFATACTPEFQETSQIGDT